MDRLDNLWSELPITVIVDDGDGYRAIYAHFNAVAGQVAASTSGPASRSAGRAATGFATGCHVHFGLFSPLRHEVGSSLRPDVQRRTKYPRWEIARIDPLLVLPALPPGRTAGPVPERRRRARRARRPSPTPADAEPSASARPEPVPARGLLRVGSGGR